MTVLTDIAALHTGSDGMPAGYRAPAAAAHVPAPAAAPAGAGTTTRPAQHRERRLERNIPARVPHRRAPSVCAVRPAARPVRFLVVLGLASAIAAVLLGMLGSVAAGDGSSVPRSTTVTQVHTGETLWDVAQRAVPGADTAAVLDRIQQLNGTSPAEVRPGQPITVPSPGAR